jgi:hypothetical protein
MDADFLADLEDLSDAEEEVQEPLRGGEGDDELDKVRVVCWCVAAYAQGLSEERARVFCILAATHAADATSEAAAGTGTARLRACTCASSAQLDAPISRVSLLRRVLMAHCVPGSHFPACNTQLDDLEMLNYDDLTAVAKLTSDPNYQDVMRVRCCCVCVAQAEAG